MKIHGYRLELKLNKEQRILCHKGAGTARYAYNTFLNKISGEYEANKSLAQMYDLPKVPSTFSNNIEWHREWVKLKEIKPWIRETSKCCGKEALRNLEKSFKRFFNGIGGYPKIKKKEEMIHLL